MGHKRDDRGKSRDTLTRQRNSYGHNSENSNYVSFIRGVTRYGDRFHGQF